MRIQVVKLNEKIKNKILFKHGIIPTELIRTLFNNPFIIKVNRKRFLAIGFVHRYITIIFEKKNNAAHIITAYPSSKAQTRLYKKRK